MNTTGYYWWYVNIWSGNGLVSSGKQAITWASVDHDLQRHMVSLGPNELTHLCLDKMAAISQTIFRCTFVNGKFCISIKISLEFISSGPIDNNQALV